MRESSNSQDEGQPELLAILKEIEKQVLENRTKHEDAHKTIKDFRRIFDQDSSRMNQAIFNDASQDEIYKETLRTVAVLIEILVRTKRG